MGILNGRIKLLKVFLWFFVAACLSTQTHASFKCYGINYNIRSGPDWAPPNEKCKSLEVIDADLQLLKKYTDNIRIYSITDCNQASLVIPTAIKYGLTISIGLWVSQDPRVFEAEKNALIALIDAGHVTPGNIPGIYVGSEAIYRKDVTANESIAYLKEIKEICESRALGSVPVTIADVGDVYIEYPELIDAVDFVALNAFPFWEKISAENAVSYFHSRLQQFIDATSVKGKTFIISETGWPSDGSNANASRASPESSATYFRDFYMLAEQQGWRYYYFEAYDALWKLAQDPTNTVEGYFGLFTKDRTLKPAIAALNLGSSSDKNLNISRGSSQVHEIGSAPGAPIVAQPMNTSSTTPLIAVDETIDMVTFGGNDIKETSATREGTSVTDGIKESTSAMTEESTQFTAPRLRCKIKN